MEAAQEDLQFLGFIRMLKESFKIKIKTWNLFTRITLLLILPLAFIYLQFFLIIDDQDDELEYFVQMSTLIYSKISALDSSERVEILALAARLRYFIFVMALSLFSTSAMVYTIANFYTARDVSFKKAMSAASKVRKTLMKTLLWSLAVAFVNTIVIGVSFLWEIDLYYPLAFKIMTMIVSGVIDAMGLLYISLFWIKDMEKSKNLIKGKRAVSEYIFLLYWICYGGIGILFETIVGLDLKRSLGSTTGNAVCWLVLLVRVLLFMLVFQTVMYFLRKSYQNENIDKASLGKQMLEPVVGWPPNLGDATEGTDARTTESSFDRRE